jgi:hypothetical protein
MVLEDHDCLKTRIAQQIVQPQLQGTQNAFDVPNGMMPQETIVIGRFNDHLVRPTATHTPIQRPALIPVIIILDAQGRKFVRYHTNRPTRTLRRPR